MAKELIDYVARSLVDHPDDVVVTVLEGEKSTIFELKVHNDDIGKIIGKHGRIAKSIRTLLNAVASKTEKRFVLEILD